MRKLSWQEPSPPTELAAATWGGRAITGVERPVVSAPPPQSWGSRDAALDGPKCAAACCWLHAEAQGLEPG